jgi:hypothetical protein
LIVPFSEVSFEDFQLSIHFHSSVALFQFEQQLKEKEGKD